MHQESVPALLKALACTYCRRDAPPGTYAEGFKADILRVIKESLYASKEDKLKCIRSPAWTKGQCRNETDLHCPKTWKWFKKGSKDLPRN